MFSEQALDAVCNKGFDFLGGRIATGEPVRRHPERDIAAEKEVKTGAKERRKPKTQST
ncbi:hypothetical protein [Mycobacterium triplex]|uniref:hypothetical protein n=1 Tax=Mycobacterium triplex TaxID=47839 RepID=UPI000A7D221D|nr:hypothetical protein [Mycobacterium triplex]